MGYYEIQCQLCGVSLAIARLRTAHEPYEFAWGEWADGPKGFAEWVLLILI